MSPDAARGGACTTSLRPVREGEWQACRMLLPETFGDGPGREYLLCTRAQRPRIVGAASFRRIQDRLSGLRVHVIPPFRRQGIGTRIIDEICAGVAAEGQSEITREPEDFCSRAGFARVDGLTTVEAPIEAMREYARELRRRLRQPRSARIVKLGEAPMPQIARLHAEHIARSGELNPWRVALADRSAELARSPILLADGSVEGILLWELEHSIAVVRSRVVTPRFQRGWANALLLAAGLDEAWESGARRVRFSYVDSNRDTRKLARRFGAEAVSVTAKFRREAGCA